MVGRAGLTCDAMRQPFPRVPAAGDSFGMYETDGRTNKDGWWWRKSRGGGGGAERHARRVSCLRCFALQTCAGCTYSSSRNAQREREMDYQVKQKIYLPG